MCKIHICYNPKYNHNQMHETKIYRVIDVQDNPYHDNEPMAITSPDEEFVACLQSQGTVVFLDTRQDIIGIHIKFSLHKLNVVCRRKWKVKNVSTITNVRFR